MRRKKSPVVSISPYTKLPRIATGLLCAGLGLQGYSHLTSNLVVIPISPTFEEPRSSVDHEAGVNLLDLFRKTDSSITPSLHTLAEAAFVESFDLVEEPITNASYEAERCLRYDWNFNPNRTTRRRVFWGCNIADDSWHPIFLSALEYRGLLSGVVFIESNRTQTLAERKLRFAPGSDTKRLLESKALWGENTVVSVDYYFDPQGTVHVPLLAREDYQRNALFPVFARQGMTRDDIAIVSDPDETFTRDFLYALKTCEVPDWQRQPNDCLAPKIRGSSIFMESTPMCVLENFRWHHPDILPGECIIEIGDESLHPPAFQRVEMHTAILRAEGWENHIPEGKLGPLWDATDFRLQLNVGELSANMKTGYVPGKTANETLHTAFHFHNYFGSLALLRNKYLTYGHPVPNATALHLDAIHPVLGLLVDCLTQENVSDTPWTYKSYLTFPSEYTPIALQRRPDYAKQRHDEMVGEYFLDRKNTEEFSRHLEDTQKELLQQHQEGPLRNHKVISPDASSPVVPCALKAIGHFDSSGSFSLDDATCPWVEYAWKILMAHETASTSEERALKDKLLERTRRNVVLIGDSQDRHVVQNLCGTISSESEVVRARWTLPNGTIHTASEPIDELNKHHFRVCHVGHLTFASFFNYGFLPSSYGSATWAKDHISAGEPLDIEDRMGDILPKYLEDVFGRNATIDMVVLHSGLWDLVGLAYVDGGEGLLGTLHHVATSNEGERSIWHDSAYDVVAKRMKALFPSPTRVIWRNMPPVNDEVTINVFVEPNKLRPFLSEHVRLMNEVGESFAKSQNWPILDWRGPLLPLGLDAISSDGHHVNHVGLNLYLNLVLNVLMENSDDVEQ